MDLHHEALVCRPTKAGLKKAFLLFLRGARRPLSSVTRGWDSNVDISCLHSAMNFLSTLMLPFFPSRDLKYSWLRLYLNSLHLHPYILSYQNILGKISKHIGKHKLGPEKLRKMRRYQRYYITAYDYKRLMYLEFEPELSPKINFIEHFWADPSIVPRRKREWVCLALSSWVSCCQVSTRLDSVI